VLKLELDGRPVSKELKNYMEELASLTDKLTVEVSDWGTDAPCVRVCRADGSETGLAFHGVPGGHEFTSFVLGLYNAAGPGQPLDADVRAAIGGLGQKKMQVLVSLSCTMCPELVTAAQRIAAENENVTAEVYDLTHFPEIRDKYNVMSVPCLVIDEGRTVTFGKKNIRQLLEILK
jgi:thioredoxin reductase (NADPH)